MDWLSIFQAAMRDEPDHDEVRVQYACLLSFLAESVEPAQGDGRGFQDSVRAYIKSYLSGVYEAHNAEHPLRYALVLGGLDCSLDLIGSYLPSWYEAFEFEGKDAETRVGIRGRDNAGWTLDGYVIPRLRSALVCVVECYEDPREGV